MSWTGSTYTDLSEISDHKEYQLLPMPIVDAGKASGEPLHAQQVTVDFTPRPEDTDELQKRCTEFWKLINKTPQLKEVRASRIDEAIPEEISIESSKNEDKIVTSKNNVDFPAIHAVNQLQAKGAVEAALGTKVCNFNNL